MVGTLDAVDERFAPRHCVPEKPNRSLGGASRSASFAGSLYTAVIERIQE